MKITKIYENLSTYLTKKPLTGWWLLIVFALCLIVTIYQTGYHLGQYIASL